MAMMQKQTKSLLFLLGLTAYGCLVTGYFWQNDIRDSKSTLLISIAFLWQVVDWIKKDSIHRNYRLPFDLGLFVWIGLYAVIPVYLFKTRGLGVAIIAPILYFAYVVLMLFLGSLLADLL